LLLRERVASKQLDGMFIFNKDHVQIADGFIKMLCSNKIYELKCNLNLSKSFQDLDERGVLHKIMYRMYRIRIGIELYTTVYRLPVYMPPRGIFPCL
jgi:hypothetical protein